MYTIIGGDGQEYGPVPTDQVKAWIASGRANLETRAKSLGTDDWKRLGDFPAFGGSGTEPPVEVETGVALDDYESLAASLIARADKLDVAFCFERSWNLLKANFWPLFGATLVTSMIALGFSLLPRFGLPASILVGKVLDGGLYYFFLQKIRGRPAGVSELFAGFRLALLPLMLAGIVVGVFTLLGLFALVLPGIYLALAYAFTAILIVDQKLSFWAAMEVSRRVITAQWWRVLGLILLAAILGLFGCALLVVGFFFVLPVIVGAIAYAYEDLCRPGASARRI